MQKLLTGKGRFKEFEGERWPSVRLGQLLEPMNRYEEWDDRRATGWRVCVGTGGDFRDELPGTRTKVGSARRSKPGIFSFHGAK